MKKFLLLVSILASFYACNEHSKPSENSNSNSVSEKILPSVKKDSINTVLDNWHKAAANANFDNYFSLMTKNGVFIGTDASENWQNEDFRKFAKPYFDKGKAWSFTSLKRTIYLSKNGETAWFDELLQTQMGICRGSGVLENVDGHWKIRHYVLSATIPNEQMDEVTKMKHKQDSAILGKFR